MSKYTKKIIILRDLLKEYSLYLKFFSKATCFSPRLTMIVNRQERRKENLKINKPYIYNKLIFCIYFQGLRPQFFFLRRYPKVSDIDIVTKRYRAKLFNEKKKWNKFIKQSQLLRQGTKYE